MGQQTTPLPTDGELRILTVLWAAVGPISIREVSLRIPGTTYATTQTLVRIMERKGLVRRGEERYPALFRPTASAATTRKHLVRDLADRAFGGSIDELLKAATAIKEKKPRAAAAVTLVDSGGT